MSDSPRPLVPRVKLTWMATVAGATLMVACAKGTSPDANAAADAGASASVSALARPSPDAGEGNLDGGADAEANEGDRTVAAFDAGASACKPLRAPYIDPDFIAPVALRLDARAAIPAAQLIFNESGIPHVVDVPADNRDASVAVSASRTRTTLPSCAVAGDVILCPDASGVVQAWRGEKHSIVAHARPGTDIAAATIDGKIALAFLMDHVTSEGVTREAWAVLEGSAPVRLSEEGSGATFIALAPHGNRLLAMTIDARVAMTPAHARLVGLESGKLAMGPDAVVFVGGSAEPHNAGALATTDDGSVFALVAVADGATAFGMAAIRIEDPPHVDEPVVWSQYPNGLDPAPIAATEDASRMIVARVRPRDAAPHARRDLEIGELAKDGTFVSACVIDEAGFIKDVEIALDRKGALWVFYRDPRGSVLERRALPARR